MKRKGVIILLLLVTYVASASVSYSIFVTRKPVSPTEETKSTGGAIAGVGNNDYEAIEFDQSKPKTEVCPLSGVKYSKDQRKWWDSHRPLGVMVENSTDARPQSGVSFADVTYEAVAEGGITRFLLVFYCQDGGIVGPVRSARTYFLDFISEYGDHPLYTHVGGANTPGPANALGQIEEYGWAGYNDINQFSVGFPTFKRDETRLGREVATEHTMYSTTSKLWQVAEKRGLTEKSKDGTVWTEGFRPYSFKDDLPADKRGTLTLIRIPYWEYDAFVVTWKYDKTTNTFLRSTGGEVHTDRNTKKQLTAKNVIVLYMKQRNANDGYENNLHLLYGTKGEGKAEVFLDGKQITGTWRKDSRTAHLYLYATDGSEIKLNPGNIWFHILPTGTSTDVE